MHLLMSFGVRWPVATFRSIGSTVSDPAYGLTLELLARITLADIEHVREWDSLHPGHRTSESRLQELADETQLLLGM
jgi:hypothetical protein